MWNRDLDTGKWFQQTDKLPKDNYENLKIDLEKVKLYSKCLSGATYLTINDFNNLYPELLIDNIGFYFDEQPNNGPIKRISESNSDEFYNKYLAEDAFTVKNLFTPEKLISSEGKNFITVDVATTEYFDFKPSAKIIIDGIQLIKGHKVLIKNQKKIKVLSFDVDVVDYFTNTLPVASYTLTDDNGSSQTYEYYDNQNGIYEYDGNSLTRMDYLSEYQKSRKMVISVKLGDTNADKEFNLKRLLNGYFSVDGDNTEFYESRNWVLRNKVDYNNIYDLNFYDIISHGPQTIFDEITTKTYSIPDRVLTVGEFGSIINNQDRYYTTSTYSISNIISNKYKVNLRSIVEVDKYYWVCGDEGVLLKVSKIDLSIEKIELYENINFTSVSFVNNLYGVVVGKFNTIYFTRDGGFNWVKIKFDEFEKYSYLSVNHIDPYIFIIGGENGVMIEFTFSNGNWFAFKRNIKKFLGQYDEYSLVEDINDFDYTNFVNIKPFSYSAGLSFSSTLENGYDILQTKIEDFHFNSETFSESATAYISFSFSNINGNFYYNSNYGLEEPATYNTYDLYVVESNSISDLSTFTVSIPTDETGNLVDGKYYLGVHLISNYEASNDSIVATYSRYYNYEFKSEKGNIILIGGNNQSIICYDINNILSPISNNFVFATFTQSKIGDIRSIERKKNTPDVYISGDKIYKFNIGSFNKFVDRTTNESFGEIIDVQDIYANKITTSTNSIYLAGNNSVLKKFELSVDTSFVDLDPSFNDRIKSRFLILDYDIGSKLNFFDDNGNYRLPDSVTFDNSSLTVTGTIFSISSLDGELSWIDYYKDSEKTFKLGSNFHDANVVKFSSNFSYTPNATKYTISSDKIGIQSTSRAIRLDIFKRVVLGQTYYIIPGIQDDSLSEFLLRVDIPPSLSTPYDLLLHKNIAVFKRSFSTKNVTERGKVENFNLGDVLELTSDVVDAKLTINRIEYYVSFTGNSNNNILPQKVSSRPTDFTPYESVDIYLYAISNFNENIINNLTKLSSPINIKNLNHYSTSDELITNLNSHPIGIGYKISKSTTSTTLECLFNEKTAYYNQQSQISVGGVTKQMKYKESFMNFGYSPTYNIFSYLNKIDPDIFYGDKEFQILPYLDSLPGNDGVGLTKNNIYIDSGSQSNILLFGSDLELQWKGLLKNTFIDLIAVSTTNGPTTFNQLLITDKYYVPSLDAYAVEFDKKLNITDSIKTFSLISRRKLSQISGDLQLLNNIQRSETERNFKMNNTNYTFTNLENSIRTKFSTDAYLKVLASDYDIRQNISAILYTDKDFQIAMNILNLESVLTYEISRPLSVITQDAFKVGFSVVGLDNKIKPGDLVFIDFDGIYDSKMAGLQTIISASNNFITTTKDYVPNSLVGEGTLKFIKKDPFFNYQPVDIFKHGSDSQVTRSVEVLPTNYVLSGLTFSLVNLDLNKFKLQLIDGLSLQELSQSYHWVLEAEVSDALIGKDQNGIVWYSGTWRCGRWFGGTWMSGEWLTGDWYRGTWNSFNVLNKIISAKVDNSYSNPDLSKWYNGRWFEGTWNDGTWYNGRRYSGDWNAGIWYNGVWNDGVWKMGFFYGGIWVQGTWENGIFNCESKPAYWLDGTFKAGDFENGIWYNGLFGNEQNIQTRFGTKSSNTRTATWHAGKWLDGEFHSFLNLDQNGVPNVSDLHKYSIWRTGVWNRGNWYGGIAYNIDFRGGTWHGGILEEIQVIGIDSILPAQTSKNKIYINGIFKFNVGDEIWIIDDERNLYFSSLGTNESPMKYRINQIIEDTETDSTGLFLNYNLSTLGVKEPYASKTYSVAENPNLDLGLRVVSKFTDVTWKSGLWTNGIFSNGQYDSGIWYNGVFDGNWGN
jgi:hypothetical protein